MTTKIIAVVFKADIEKLRKVTLSYCRILISRVKENKLTKRHEHLTNL